LFAGSDTNHPRGRTDPSRAYVKAAATLAPASRVLGHVDSAGTNLAIRRENSAAAP